MKTLRFLLINLFVRDHKKTLEIINGLDNTHNVSKPNFQRIDFSSLLESEDSNQKKVDFKPTKKKDIGENGKTIRVKSKKDEIVESLKYLRSKPTKTKQDKESIYTLEVLLKNMV
jgi:hypothetical protein